MGLLPISCGVCFFELTKLIIFIPFNQGQGLKAEGTVLFRLDGRDPAGCPLPWFPCAVVPGFAGSPWTVFVYMTEGRSSRLFSECRKWLYTRPWVGSLAPPNLTTACGGYLRMVVSVIGTDFSKDEGTAVATVVAEVPHRHGPNKYEGKARIQPRVSAHPKLTRHPRHAAHGERRHSTGVSAVPVAIAIERWDVQVRAWSRLRAGFPVANELYSSFLYTKEEHNPMVFNFRSSRYC